MREVAAASLERARSMRNLTDKALYEEYAAFVNDPANLNKTPYLVSALREIGVWARIEKEGVRRAKS